MIFIELANAFTIFTTLAFWLTEAKHIYPAIPDTLTGINFKIYITVVHIVPAVTSIGQIVFTQMYLLKKDWSKVFVAGLAYAVCSGFATFLAGHPISAFATWENVPHTAALLLGQATAMAAIHYACAVVSQMYYVPTKQ